MSSKLVVDVEDVYKSFSNGRYVIYNGVNLQVHEGDITFILGPSGSGKSVLLKHIVGLLRPDKGKIRIYGQEIPYNDSSQMKEMRKHFGVLFQHAALFDDMTVLENVSFPLNEHRKDLSEKKKRDIVSQKLEAVGLDPKSTLEKFPRELSGGMKKRVGLARAIVLEPQILIYDEPTTGLDPVTRAMVDELIIEMNRKFGLTSLVISHDILSALHSAQEIAFLHGGKFAFVGVPSEFKKCKHPVVRSFLEAEERHRQEIRP